VKIFLCRYQKFAAVIAADGIGDARTVVVETLGKAWNQGVDDRKQISCREARDVCLIDTSKYQGEPLLLQYSAG